MLAAIDDVDRIDGISRRCLWDFVDAETPANLVLLLSSEERPPPTTRGRREEREILGLTRAEASALISAGRGVDRETGTDAKSSTRRVEPLYLEQYRRWRGERPKDRAPTGLREIVEARVHELDPAPRRVLQAIAVGGPISAVQIAELVERTDGIDEAVRALADGALLPRR